MKNNTYQLAYVSDNIDELTLVFIKSQTEEVYRLKAEPGSEILSDLADVMPGDTVELYVDEKRNMRARLIMPKDRNISPHGRACVRVLENAEYHIINGEKDPALEEATDWLIRYMGLYEKQTKTNKERSICG